MHRGLLLILLFVLLAVAAMLMVELGRDAGLRDGHVYGQVVITLPRQVA